MPYLNKEDQAAYHKAWTERNRHKRYAANKRWKEKARAWFRSLKDTLYCTTCGETHFACLEFHHIDPNTKEATVGSIAGRWGAARIKAELNKCIVLCANCHRKLHFLEEV